MKGYLKTPQGLFPLAPKVTTIGREGCDLVIPWSSIDQQHALLEYIPDEECFILQDLNSVHGTYVNDCRVDNISIRLCPGDIIRFGKSPMKHELIIEQQQQQQQQQRVSYLPLTTQTAWAQPLALLQDETPHSDLVYSRGLPHLKTIVSTTTQFAPSPSAVTALPRPPQSLRSRPLSAGSRRQFLDRTPAVGFQKTSKASGWGSGQPSGLLRSSSSSDLLALQEKEQRQLHLEEEMRRLEDEMQRLSHYEIECHRKDAVVNQLHKEISQLQQRLRTAETRQNSHQLQETDVTQKLRILEREVAAKKEEVNILRNKINAMQRGNDSGNLTYRTDDVTEVQRLRNELSQANNERRAANEYIRNLEGQLLLLKTNNSQSSEKDFDNLTAQLRDKENELDKMKGINDELKDKIEKITALEKLLKEAETAKEEQSVKMVSLISSFAEKEKMCDDRIQEVQDLQKQLEDEKTKVVELTEENSAKQTEIANLSSKFDGLIANLGQICPDLATDASDVAEVVTAFNKIMEECLTYKKEIEKLETKITEVDELSSGHKTLMSDLSEVLTTLGTNGCFSRELKLEATAVRSKSYPSQIHDEIKDLFVHLLEIQLRWEDEIEDAFEGDEEYNPKTSSTGPGKWIAETLKKLSAVEREVRSLELKLDEADELHKIDLEVALDALRDDLTKNYEDRLEKVKLDSEEKLAEEIRTIESVKRDEFIASERTRINELKEEVEHLKLDINKKEEELREKSDKAQKAEEEILVYKQTETDLRQKVVELENRNADAAERFGREIGEKLRVHQDEVNEYKEQIHQHALTICAMEERLNLAATRHKEFQSEITALKSEITAIQSRPQQVNESTFHTNLQTNHPGHHPSTTPQTLHPSPPQTQHPTPSLKPRIVLHTAVPDGTLLQQTLAQVQKENADYLKQIQEQQDCMFALRRDLAGATARLTDVSGELSEAQKQEIEQFRVKIKEQESEIISLQQQLAKLSDIIDKQTAEIKGLNVEASKQKVIIGKYKNKVKEKEAKLKDAEEEISKAKSELSHKTSVLDNETAVTSQMSLIGAQCRGERHEQVITRQREALSELRAKLRAMEQGDIPLLSQNEAVQEVAILRNQLEELRSLQANTQQRPTEWGMISDLPNHQQFDDLRYGPNPINRQGPLDPAYGNDVISNHLDATQHSTFREVSEAFELSENLYLSLLRGIASSLELDRIGGMRSLLNVSRDERMRLAGERQRACEELTDTVKALRERVSRKDELLQGYEKDLAKLRHAENLTELTSGQVQNVMTGLRKKTEEVQCLRESLRRTKDRLEQEKRLNTAIKHKKTFHLEHEPVTRNGWPKHHCIQPDAHAELHAKRKQQNERKCRQYEKLLKAKEAEIAMHRKLLAE